MPSETWMVALGLGLAIAGWLEVVDMGFRADHPLATHFFIMAVLLAVGIGLLAWVAMGGLNA